MSAVRLGVSEDPKKVTVRAECGNLGTGVTN